MPDRELDITPLAREGVFGKGQAGREIMAALRTVQNEGVLVWIIEDGARVAALVSSEAAWAVYGIRPPESALSAQLEAVRQIVADAPVGAFTGQMRKKLEDALGG